MINSIIFSKDRACQLEALIRSFETNGCIRFKHHIIYTYSNNDFKKGYDKLINESKHKKDYFVFIKEADLKTDMLKVMNTEFTALFVDDQIMFKPMPNIDLSLLGENEVFSLRLGRNISEPHLSYPLSTDGHIYRTEDIKPLIELMNFNNPNKFEAGMQKFKKGWIVTFLYQCMVSIPHNRVSSKSHCSFSGLYTQEILNKYWLDGYVIDINKMDFSNIKNVHKEIELKFKSI